MAQYYVPYVRTATGVIHRLAEGIFSADEAALSAYPYEETVAGLPESQVYWEASDGLSLGIAPLIVFPHEKFSRTLFN
ncbi:hypothetical protein SAMN05216308_10194 [Nitrosospira sp. Nsp13]|jgi:hypothetical protein|nr:hypothetical protein SAMN05216308_10194 [Nitrosospira sp. Nsp13]